jgi:hypothetical protein
MGVRPVNVDKIEAFCQHDREGEADAAEYPCELKRFAPEGCAPCPNLFSIIRGKEIAGIYRQRKKQNGRVLNNILSDSLVMEFWRGTASGDDSDASQLRNRFPGAGYGEARGKGAHAQAIAMTDTLNGRFAGNPKRCRNIRQSNTTPAIRSISSPNG